MRSLSTVAGSLMALVLSTLAPAAGAKGDHVGTLSFTDASGRSIALDQPGVLYLIDFWALGCTPCAMEMPDLDRLASEYGSSGRVELVSVVLSWSGAQLNKVAKDAGTTQTVLADPSAIERELKAAPEPR